MGHWGTSSRIKIIQEIGRNARRYNEIQRGFTKQPFLGNYLSGSAIHFHRGEIRVNGRKVKDGKAESSVAGTETQKLF